MQNVPIRVAFQNLVTIKSGSSPVLVFPAEGSAPHCNMEIKIHDYLDTI